MERNTFSLLICLGTILSAIVCGVSAYLLSHIPLIWQISGGVSILLALTYLVIERNALAQIFSRRATQFSIKNFINVIVLLVIIVFATLIVREYDVKVDITKNKLHSLSEQSVKVVEGLKSEVTLRAFVFPDKIQEYDALFSKYLYHSKFLKKEYVDIDKDPLSVQQNNIKEAGTILVVSEARTSRVENLANPDDPKAEEKLTNAIIQVAKGEKKKVYFISGHGEKLASDQGRDGYSEIKGVLESGRFLVEDLTLVEKERIPQDAEIIISAGPKSDFMKHEIEMLESYIRTGGKGLFLLDPNSSPSLKDFFSRFGVLWNPKKTVLETNSLQQLAGGNPLTPIVTSYDPSHEITQDIRQLSIFPIATPIEKDEKTPENVSLTSLFSTSSRSFEVSFLGDKVKVDEKKDRKGPLSLGIAVSGKAEVKANDGTKPKEPDAVKPKDPEFRMVVVGASNFASNSVKRFGVNSDLFQNMLSWLAKEEDLIAIRPKPTDTSELEVTNVRQGIINLASIIILPFGMFFSGFFVWYKRKRR